MVEVRKTLGKETDYSNIYLAEYAESLINELNLF